MNYSDLLIDDIPSELLGIQDYIKPPKRRRVEGYIDPEMFQLPVIKPEFATLEEAEKAGLAKLKAMNVPGLHDKFEGTYGEPINLADMQAAIEHNKKQAGLYNQFLDAQNEAQGRTAARNAQNANINRTLLGLSEISSPQAKKLGYTGQGYSPAGFDMAIAPFEPDPEFELPKMDFKSIPAPKFLSKDMSRTVPMPRASNAPTFAPTLTGQGRTAQQIGYLSGQRTPIEAGATIFFDAISNNEDPAVFFDTSTAANYTQNFQDNANAPLFNGKSLDNALAKSIFNKDELPNEYIEVVMGEKDANGSPVIEIKENPTTGEDEEYYVLKRGKYLSRQDQLARSPAMKKFVEDNFNILWGKVYDPSRYSVKAGYGTKDAKLRYLRDELANRMINKMTNLTAAGKKYIVK